MTHRPTFWSGESGDVAHHWLGDVFCNVLGGVLLRVTTNFTNHDDRLGLRIILERLDRSNVGGADDRISTNADTAGESQVRQLVHHLVGQGAGLRYEPDLAWLAR